MSVPRASTSRRVSSPSRARAAGDAVELRRRVVGRDADRRQHHHPAGQLVAQHVLDHLERRGVGPLQVVEDDEHRVDRRLAAQQLGDGLEQEVALDAGSGRSARASGTSCSRSGSSRASRPRSATTRRRASLDTARRTARTASTIGSNGTIASAVARPHSTTAPTRVHLGGELGGQPRLAGAGLALQQREVAGRRRTSPATPRARRRAGRRARRTRRGAARTAGPGSGTGDGPGGAGAAAAWAACSAASARSTAAAGGVHVLAGAARSGSWLRIARLQVDQLGRRVEAELVGEHARGSWRTPAARRPGAPFGRGRPSGGGRTPRAAGARRPSARARARPRRGDPAPAARRSGPRRPPAAARPNARRPDGPSPRRRPRRAPDRATRRARSRGGRGRRAGSLARAARASATWSSKRCTSSRPRDDRQHVARAPRAAAGRRRRGPGAAVTRSSAGC